MNRKGFTLIELLIVVVIIGILAAIAIPKFANTKEKAYLASMKSDLRNLITAEEAYFADSVKYAHHDAEDLRDLRWFDRAGPGNEGRRASLPIREPWFDKARTAESDPRRSFF